MTAERRGGSDSGGALRSRSGRDRSQVNPQGVAQGGASTVELLLALPVILLLGLGIVQFALVYQAKHALDHALTQAARQGAVDHASTESIRAGLASGLAPYLYGATDWDGLLQAELRAAGHVDEGSAAGWITLRQRSPTQESFDDWGEPALDAMGRSIPGMMEIANDNLDNRRLRMQPVSGVAAVHLSEPIGQASGQSLADANLLRLELVYGVRLVVPVVGPLVIRTLSIWNGCKPIPRAPAQGSATDAASAAPPPDRLGLLVLGVVEAQVSQQPWMCQFLGSGDGEGNAGGRIPIRASSTMRMMSTARRSELTGGRGDSASGSGLPELVQPSNEEPLLRDPTSGGDQRSSNPASQVAPSSHLDNGFLRIGTDRRYPMLSVHPALCPA